VDIRGDKVRLGIDAPQEIPVHRKEVYDAIKRENAASTGVRVEDLSHADRKLRHERPDRRLKIEPNGEKSGRMAQ